MRALILAAGRGSRMGGQTSELPKCLLEVGGRALVEHQLEALADCGAGPVGMVVGYRADDVREVVGIRAELIHNHRWRQTNSLYSLWTAREWLAAGGPVLVLNSDVLFDVRIVERLLAAPGDVLAFDSSSGQGAEQMKVKVSDGRLAAVGKELPADEVSGENVGILRFEEETLARLLTLAEARIEAGAENEWLGSALSDLIAERTVHAVDVAGLPWAEIDFAYDLDRARKQVWPAIRQQRRQRGPRRIARAAAVLAAVALFGIVVNVAAVTPSNVDWEALEIPALPAVKIESELRSQRWWQIDQAQSAALRLAGPTELRIESRLVLDGGEGPRRYALEVALDGVPLKWQDHLASPSGRWRFEDTPVGKHRSITIEVPEGLHELRLGLASPGPARALVRVRQPMVDAVEE